MNALKLIGGLPRRVATATPDSEVDNTPLPELTADETLVLVAVARSPNCSRHEIASELRMAPSRCDLAIRGLEKKGLIVRKEEWIRKEGWNCVQASTEKATVDG